MRGGRSGTRTHSSRYRGHYSPAVTSFKRAPVTTLHQSRHLHPQIALVTLSASVLPFTGLSLFTGRSPFRACALSERPTRVDPLLMGALPISRPLEVEPHAFAIRLRGSEYFIRIVKEHSVRLIGVPWSARTLTLSNLVGSEGVEPSRLSALVSETSAYASSARSPNLSRTTKNPGPLARQPGFGARGLRSSYARIVLSRVATHVSNESSRSKLHG